jgi:GntP family gluconate:H+ symporter
MSSLLTSILVGISILMIIILTSKFKIEAFVALFLVAFLLACAVLPAKTIVKTIQDGFGTTMGTIGFLIIFGAIIGIALDKTGGTLSIARFILSKTGEKKSARAIGVIGFITGLPIFCNSGFIILSGLSKSLSSKSKTAMPFIATVLHVHSIQCIVLSRHIQAYWQLRG